MLIKDAMLIKDTIAKDPVALEQRLQVCLYCFSEGDYIHTIAKHTGLGSSAVCNFVTEVCETIVEVLRKDYVDKSCLQKILIITKSH